MLEVVVISSNRLRARTACNRPFTGSDGATEVEASDSTGSCIVSIGGTGRTPEQMARLPQSQFQL